MRVINCHLENFASYKELDFDFDDKGLCLISGPTGAGKSTLCDAIPWILFGRTAKMGAVDEVIKWNEEETKGTLRFDLNGKICAVTRIRGFRSDLILSDTAPRRGKDLQDTQKLINNLLGLDVDLYLSGAYFHEFSQTAQFFTTTAKNRRQIIEQLADLKMAKTLTENISEYKKEAKESKADLESRIELLKNDIAHCSRQYADLSHKRQFWFIQKDARVESIRKTRDNFDQMRRAMITEILEKHHMTRIDLEQDVYELESSIKLESYYEDIRHIHQEKHRVLQLDSTCNECGAPKNAHKQLLLTKSQYDLERDESLNGQKKIQLQSLNRQLKTHAEQLEIRIKTEESRHNPYIEQLEAILKEKNPYDVESVLSELNAYKDALAMLKTALENDCIELSDLETLQDVTDVFRATIVESSIQNLEDSTNRLLEDHFDAELRVNFAIEGSDKLEVTISKDSNQASYAQLSKGQRQLLKLCFGISVMKAVSNHHGIGFNAIFLDEFADGLDETMKAKAYHLLEALALDYSSVFAIDHSEALKTMFINKYEVRLVNGESQIEAAD